MSILDRIDATVAGRCPCGADPAPGSAWCSEDCRPTHEGPDTFGSDAMRWSAEAPPVAGRCPCGCGLSPVELAGWELAEPEISDDGRSAVLRPNLRTQTDGFGGIHTVVTPPGRRPFYEVNDDSSEVSREFERFVSEQAALRFTAWQRRVLGLYFAADHAAVVAAVAALVRSRTADTSQNP